MESTSSIVHMKCEGCMTDFPINKIKTHLARNPSCFCKYTQEQKDELEKQVDQHKKERISNYKAKRYSKQKENVNVFLL